MSKYEVIAGCTECYQRVIGAPNDKNQNDRIELPAIVCSKRGCKWYVKGNAIPLNPTLRLLLEANMVRVLESGRLR